MRRSRSRSMRTQVRNAIVLVAASAVLLFGLPLAIVLDRLSTSQTLTGLQRDATRAVAALPDNIIEAGTPLRLPQAVGVYDARGSKVSGPGPARSALAARAVDGREHDGRDGTDLAVVVPVLSDTTVAGSIRTAEPLARLHTLSYQRWGMLAALALLVVAVAMLLARRSAITISRPFETLTLAARRLGDGQYDLALPDWRITEADAAGDALIGSARQIEALVRTEREFVRDASHQLRTPLAAMQLALQRPTPDVAAALSRTRDLETTIADLVALRRGSAGGVSRPSAVAAEAVRRWQTTERPVVLRQDGDEPVALSGAALRQSLDVLLDNAMRHGRGTITVTVEPYGDAVLVEVADQGDGFRAESSFGTGLALVTGILERAGGSLLIRRRAPQPRIALLVPMSDQSSSNR